MSADRILQNETVLAQRELTVAITDIGGNPITGLDQTMVVIQLAKPGGNFGASSATLTEATGAADPPGLYRMRMAAGDVDTVGQNLVEISSGSSTIKTFPGAFEVYPAERSVEVSAGAITAIQTGLATSTALATAQTAITAIKAKTDNLPAAPADESLIIAATNAIATAIASVKTDTTAVLANQLLIKALLRLNSKLDGGAGVPGVQYNSRNFAPVMRLRCFANKAAEVASVAGHADDADGEVARFSVAGADDGTGRLYIYSLVQEHP